MPTSSTRRLALMVRPARVAVPVGTGQNWRHRSLRMIEAFSRKWGGTADVIVPLEGEAIPEPFIGLLEEFDPDWLGVFAHSYRYHQLTDPDGFEAWLTDYSAKSGAQSGIAPEEIRRMVLDDLDHPRERYGPAAALEKELLRRIAPFHRGDLLVGHRFLADVPMETLLTDMLGIADLPSLKVCQFDARAIDEDLHLMLAMRFGAVAPRYEEGLKARGIALASVIPEEIDLPILVKLALAGTVPDTDWEMHAAYRKMMGKEAESLPRWAEPTFWETSAFGWSAHGCSWLRYVRNPKFEWPYVLVVGDELGDFALGFMLERLTGHAMWMPARLLRGEGDLHQTVRQETIDFLDEVSHRTDEEAHVVSTSLAAADLEEVVEALRAERRSAPWGGESVHAKAIGDLRRGWPRRLYARRPEEVRHETFEAAAMVGTLSTPQPDVKGTDPEKVHWEVEVHVDDPHYPVRDAVSPLLSGTGEGGDDHVRSGAEAITYHSHAMNVFIFSGAPLEQRLARPRMRAPEAEEVFQALLQHGGLRGVRSNAGRFTQQTLDRFGGLDALLAAVRSARAGPILQGYRSRAKSEVDPGVFLEGISRRFLSLENMAKLAGASTADEIAEIRALADDYIAKHIFRRGLALQCPVCRYAGWFRLVDIDDDVTCQRCRSRWVMTQPTWKKPADEPVWRYELDEVVFQAVDGNIVAPVLALDHLRQKSRDFLFAPEMDVLDGDKLVGEVDVWVIARGRIVIGEAKTTDEFAATGKEPDRAARLFSIADAVTAHEVLVATTRPAWNARAKAALSAEAAKWPNVKLNLVEGLK